MIAGLLHARWPFSINNAWRCDLPVRIGLEGNNKTKSGYASLTFRGSVAGISIPLSTSLMVAFYMGEYIFFAYPMSDHPTPSPPTLDYFSKADREAFEPPWKITSYRIAIGCWFVPLVMGISNFTCWYLTRLKFLLPVGVFIIVAGFVAASFSLACGGYFLIRRLSSGARIWKQAFLPVLVLLGFLVISAFVTAACISVAY